MGDKPKVTTPNSFSRDDYVENAYQKKNTLLELLVHPSSVKYAKHVTGKVLFSPERTHDTYHSLKPGVSGTNITISPFTSTPSDHEPLSKPLDFKIRKVVRVTRQGTKNSSTDAEVLVDVPIQIAST